MRNVFREYPLDHDVMALFVEALMMRTVRRLWDLKTGAPAPNSDVLEALQVCERSIALADGAGRDQHPAIVHLHLHLLEMSTTPERAMRSADRLGTMCPGRRAHEPYAGPYLRAVRRIREGEDRERGRRSARTTSTSPIRTSPPTTSWAAVTTFIS